MDADSLVRTGPLGADIPDTRPTGRRLPKAQYRLTLLNPLRFKFDNESEAFEPDEVRVPSEGTRAVGRRHIRFSKAASIRVVKILPFLRVVHRISYLGIRDAESRRQRDQAVNAVMSQ
jgi:hypothetical protein